MAITTDLQEKKIEKSEITKKPFVPLNYTVKNTTKTSKYSLVPSLAGKQMSPRTTHISPHKFKKSRLQEQVRLSGKNYETLPV